MSPPRLRRPAVLAAIGPVLLLLQACHPPPPLELTLPAPLAPPPAPRPGGLKAGLGRADITPPPGLGLAGNGMEGRRARGYRTRLYARALVLENGAGERLAIVATDLGLLSAQLQRRAAWIADSLRDGWLGADHLIVTATHTHSGPGNFLDAFAYNLMASAVPGYDSSFADSLARGVARALVRAIDDLQPAAAAWGSTPIWGFTRNRSYRSYLENPEEDRPFFGQPPAQLADSERAVDPTWLILRVDYRDPATGAHRPAGAFSVYAMHGTVDADVDSLYDGDIHALLERGLERHMDSVSGLAPSAVPHSTHLLANGTEGDVSADWPAASRCPPPRLVPIGWSPGPRADHPAPAWLEVSGRRAAGCSEASRRFAVDTARALTRHVAALFDALGDSLRDDLPIRVAFGVLPLQGALAPPGLCNPPNIGLSAVGGAPDGRTRLFGWRPFGVLRPVINDGSRAPLGQPSGCQGAKRVPFRIAQFILGRLGVVPDFAQFTVARLGNTVLATAPVEVTTVAGEFIRRRVRLGLGALGDTIRHLAVAGLTNGYLSYLTTRFEYGRQRYEGASTLHGPMTDSVFAWYLGTLAARLAPGYDGPVPATPVLRVWPGDRVRLLPVHPGPPDPPVSRRISRVECARGAARVEWVDEPPERILPHDGPIVRVEEQHAGDWTRLTWDDDPWLEVVPLHAQGSGYLWRLSWNPHPAPAGPLRIRLEPRASDADTLIAAPLPPNCFRGGPGR